MRLGDLDTLLEELEKAQYSKDYCIDHHIEQSINMSMVRMVIKEAPSVDVIPNEEGYEMYGKWYLQGYERGKNERPQGKWVKIFENPFTNGYKCPFCGHEIHVTEQFLPKVTECEECGADMKGGAE